MQKKSVLSLFFVFISIFCFAKEITLCSWNVEHAPKKRGNMTEANAIITVIQNENIDIMLLQEISIAEPFLEKITEKLGDGWTFFSTKDYALRKPYNNLEYKSAGKNDRMDNAVLFNKNVITAKDLFSDYDLDNFQNCKYKTDKNIMQLIRFDIPESDQKLYVINIHLPFNDKPHRERDLKQAIAFCNDIVGTHYKIIAGDFNYWKSDIAPKAPEYIVGVTERTTLSQKKPSFSSSYDHFVYNSKVASSITKEPTRLAQLDGSHLLLGTYEPKDPNHKTSSFEYYKENISDHTPIIMSIDLK